MTNFARVISAQSGRLTVEGDDGRTYTVTGSRNLRNNNPGNIEAGSYANSLGAIGSDGRFAVFPSYAAGQAAQHDLQFNSAGYAGRTIQSAIDKYAPPSENDSRSYAAAVARAVGVPVTTPLSSLNAAQRAAYLVAQQGIEGSSAAVLRDSDGVQLPPADIPGADPVSPLDAPPGYGINSPGPPDDRSADADYYPPSYTPIPLAPLPADAGASVGDAFSGQYLSGDGGLGYGTPSIPATPAAPPEPATNAKGYTVGQTYKLADGASYQANADGSFTKTANTPHSLTPIQLALIAAQPGAMQNLNNTVAGVKSLAGQAQGALGTAGSFLGGLFSGQGATPAAGGYNQTTEDQRNALLALPSGLSDERGVGGTDGLAFDPDLLSFTPNLNTDGTYNGPSFDAGYDPASGLTMPYATPNSAANFGVKNASGSPDDRDTTSGLNIPNAPTLSSLLPSLLGGSQTSPTTGGSSSFYYDPGTGQGDVALPAGVRPNVSIPSQSDWASSYYSSPSSASSSDDGGWGAYMAPSAPAAPALSYDNSGWGDYSDNFANGSDLSSLSAHIPTSSVPQYISVAHQEKIPGSDPAGDASSGVTWNDATGQFELNSAPAASAPIYKTIYTRELNPAYVAPTYTTPPLAESAGYGETDPDAFSTKLGNWFGQTPLGHIGSFLQGQAPVGGGGLLGMLTAGIGASQRPSSGGGLLGALAPQSAAPGLLGALMPSTNGYLYQANSNGGYTNVGSANPSLSPAQQYAIAAAPALNQPNGSRPSFSGVSPGGSISGVSY